MGYGIQAAQFIKKGEIIFSAPTKLMLQGTNLFNKMESKSFEFPFVNTLNR